MELYEKIREKLADSVVDIFADIQEELNIQCGDCPPLTEYALENSIDDLAENIKTAIKYQMN